MLPSRLLNKTRMIVTNSDIELAKDIITSNKFNYKLKAATKPDRRVVFRYERLVDELLKVVVPNGSSYIANDLKSCSIWLTPSMKSCYIDLFFILRRSAGLFAISNIMQYQHALMSHKYEKNSCFLFLWGHSMDLSKKAAADIVLSPMLKYNDEGKIHTYTDTVEDTDLYHSYGFKEDAMFKFENDSVKILKRSPLIN